MNNLPTGTVTFLFTDIEGSTKLWQQHPEAMPNALACHHAILNETIAAHGGYVFQIIGDAFCAAFSTARDGLDAALAAQRALRDATWGETGAIRVRMALHTGTADVRVGEHTSGEYVSGLTLSRAARLLSAGHGGQILLSLPTTELVRDHLLPETILRDLDAHRLKDLIRPEHIYQADVPDLRSEFLPLKTLDSHPNNLPIQLTSFIGREQEMARVNEILNGTRLVTLTGEGGAGKTRLALQAAADLVDEFPDGVWFVEFAPLTDPELIPQTVASVLGLREAAGQSFMAILSDYLRAKTILLIFDNCEHLIDACAKFANTILHAAPKVKLLATSREALGIAGETAYRVASLSLPPQDFTSLQDLGSLTQYEAVRLFIDRALAVQPDFRVTNANATALAQICLRLDGIPLALELAAARVKSLSMEQIAARLDDRFRLLTGGSRTAMPRQQTLRAAIDWSYDLLAEEERVLLRRLSVFEGGWTLEAAQAVCSFGPVCAEDILDLLARLVDKSLVGFEQYNSEARYRILETIRQYARDKLFESGEGERIRNQHLDFFLRLAEEALPELYSAEQVMWLNRLETEHKNLRVALAWSQRSESGVEVVLRLIGALGEFWSTRGYLTEGRERISAVLAHSQVLKGTAAYGKVLLQAADLAYRQSDYPAAQSFGEESMVIFRELGDKPSISYTKSLLGMVAEEKGDYATAIRLQEEALALNRELNDDTDIASALSNLAWAVLRCGDYARANAYLEEALAINRRIGDKGGMGFNLSGLAEVALREGKLEPASKLIEKSLVLRREVGHKWGIGASLGTWAWIALRQFDWESAFVRLKESVQVRKEIGDRGGIAFCLERLAEVAIGKHEAEKAARIFGAAESMRASLRSMIDPVDKAEYELNVASLRAELGEGKFNSAWEEGQKMTLVQAVDYALEEVGSE
jgi:predicted ATPase/class 3 adenylate cyclase